MRIEHISSAAGGRNNEDLIAVYKNGGVTDIVIMDGASSVADQNYIDDSSGDVVWFVRNFAQALEQEVKQDGSQEECVALALKEVKSSFQQLSGGAKVPLYAWPIAAMTWIRISEVNGSRSLRIYCVGDCKAFLLLPDHSVIDLDPYVNPQELVLQEAIAKLSSEGVTDARSRMERLMPMLRARREFQNASASPSVLCLDPQGRFNARQHTVQADAASMLLAMTDGFYRIVDTYRMHSIEELASQCSRRDLAAILKDLRDFESAVQGSASLSVKNSDDASAISCVFL